MIPATRYFSSRWWIVFLRGLLAVVFGFIAWFWPGLTLVALVWAFGIYAFADGIMNLAVPIVGVPPAISPWGFVLRGVLEILTGLVVLVWPSISAMALLYVIAGWAIGTGVIEAIEAFRFRDDLPHPWLLALSGVLAVAFGVLVALNPGDGAIALVWTIGVYAVSFGVLLIIFSVRLKGLGGRLGPIVQSQGSVAG